MEKIVSGQYKCLREAYDADMDNADSALRLPTFYTPLNGFCGPTGEVDSSSGGQEALGLRCAAGSCCSLAEPAQPLGVDDAIV
jgi:hypothetical protein